MQHMNDMDRDEKTGGVKVLRKKWARENSI